MKLKISCNKIFHVNPYDTPLVTARGIMLFLLFHSYETEQAVIGPRQTENRLITEGKLKPRDKYTFTSQRHCRKFPQKHKMP